MAVTFETAAELVQKLGNIPLEAHLFHPSARYGHRARPARRDSPFRPSL